MTNTTFATQRTVIGVAKEATRGTPVAPTAFIPMTKCDFSPKQVKLIDSGWRGSMGKDYGMQNGPRSGELDMSGDVFVDTFPWLLGAIFGSDTVTGSSPYLHTMALENTGDGQPTSLTLTDTQGGLQARVYPGFQASDLTLKFDAAGLLTWDCKGMSWQTATASSPTPSYSTVVPIPSWLGQLTIAGTSTATLQTAEFAFKRDSVEPVFTAGAQDPYTIHVGGLEVTTKATFVAADESRLLSYLNNTQEAVVMTFTQGASGVLKFQATQHYFDDAKITRGKTYMEVETTGKCIFNATDATAAGGGLSPCQTVTTNAVATGVYQ